jgi:hypothetical protein
VKKLKYFCKVTVVLIQRMKERQDEEEPEAQPALQWGLVGKTHI